MNKLDIFLVEYKKQLEMSMAKNPEQYVIKDVDVLLGRMVPAIQAGSFNQDSASFKATCKVLGIKHTYKAIADYING